MSLHDAIKEVEEQEKKMLQEQGGETAAEAPVDDEPAAEAKSDDGAVVEGKEGKEKAADPVKEEKKPEHSADDKAHARLRWEAAEQKRRADQMEAELARLKAPAAPVKAADADKEPDPAIDPEGHLRWQLQKANEKLEKFDKYVETQQQREQREQIRSRAIDEFTSHEDRFKEKTPDYQDVTSFGLQKLAGMIQQQNPNLQGAALKDEIERRVLTLAAQGQQLGFDPAEYLYLTSKNWGYQPPAVENAEENKKSPDFKKIVDQKKKSASSLAAGGKNGNAPLSREAVLDKKFGFKDFLRLTPAELREMESL